MVLEMVFRARKVSGTFEKRGPGYISMRGQEALLWEALLDWAINNLISRFVELPVIPTHTGSIGDKDQSLSS